MNVFNDPPKKCDHLWKERPLGAINSVATRMCLKCGKWQFAEHTDKNNWIDM